MGYGRKNPATIKIDNPNVAELESQLAQIASITKYNNDLLAALSAVNYLYIPAGTTITLSQTLTATHLQGKKILGAGRKNSTIKFVGNIDCFNLDAITNFAIDGVGIEVDTTNTKDVFKFIPTTSTIKDVVIGNDMEIRCPSYSTAGQYVGIHMTALPAGVYKNRIGAIEIHFPSKGIYLDGSTPTSGVAWANANKFFSPNVLGYKLVGIGIEMTAGAVNCMISDNAFLNPNVYDFVNTGASRRGFIIDGKFNSFVGIGHYNDSGDSTTNNIGLSFKESKEMTNNLIIGGHIEGFIENGHMRVANKVDFDYEPAGVGYWGKKLTSKIKNVLRNPEFQDGLQNYNLSAATAVIANDNKTPSGKKVTITSSGVNGDLTQTIPNKQTNAIGKKIVFVACCKSTAQVLLVIDESTDLSFNVYDYNSSFVGYRTVIVSRTISVDNPTLACTLRVKGAGNTADVAFMYAQIVSDEDDINGLEVQNTFYGNTGNYGTATIANGTTAIAVNHGLDYIPNAAEISLMPISGIGSAKHYWISNITTTQFTVNIDVNAGIDVSFSWRANLR
jgi:hypothetical protein